MHLHIISWYALLLEEKYFHQEEETVSLTIIHINPLNAELNSICCLLALLGAHRFLHVSRIRVKYALRSFKPPKTPSFLNFCSLC
jgi:hypothetical protein